MKGGAYLSPFTALSSPNLKKVPIYCWADREFSSRRIVKLSLELTLCCDFLHHNRVALTTRPWHVELAQPYSGVEINSSKEQIYHLKIPPVRCKSGKQKVAAWEFCSKINVLESTSLFLIKNWIQHVGVNRIIYG